MGYGGQSAVPQAFLCHWLVAQDEPEPAIRKSYQAVERHGETIRVRDTVLLKSGPRKTSTPYVAKISALWENPESGTPCLDFDLALVSLCFGHSLPSTRRGLSATEDCRRPCGFGWISSLTFPATKTWAPVPLPHLSLLFPPFPFVPNGIPGH